MKKLFTMPLMVIALICATLLAGCQMGSNAEASIRASLTEKLDELKDGGSEDFVKSVLEGTDESFEQLGMDEAEFVKAYLEGFDYKIGDIEVNEDKGTATADVSLSVKSIRAILEDFQAKFGAELSDKSLLELSDEDELVQLGGDALMQAAEDAKTASRDISLQYDLVDGTWTPNKDVFNAQVTMALM